MSMKLSLFFTISILVMFYFVSCSRSRLRKEYSISAERLIQDATKQSEDDFFANFYPIITKLDESLFPNPWRTYQANLELFKDTKYQNDLCYSNQSLELLSRVKDELIQIRTNSKINGNFTDKYTPFLMQLREKYKNLKSTTVDLNDNFSKISLEFNEKKDAFLAYAQLILSEYDDAISTINFFSKYKMLKMKNEMHQYHEKYLKQNHPQVISKNVTEFLNEFTAFYDFCFSDLFGQKCTDDQKEQKLSEKVLEVYDKLTKFDVSNVDTSNDDDLLAIVKEIRKYLALAKETIYNKVITGDFSDLTTEYIDEIDRMNEYLYKKKPINIEDYILPFDANSTSDTLNKTFDVYNFEQHFKNLLKSTEFICENVVHPFFGKYFNSTSSVDDAKFLNGDSGSLKTDKKTDTINIINKIINGNYQSNLLIGKDEKYDENFIKENNLDCFRISRDDKFKLKSECFNNFINNSNKTDVFEKFDNETKLNSSDSGNTNNNDSGSGTNNTNDSGDNSSNKTEPSGNNNNGGSSGNNNNSDSSNNNNGTSGNNNNTDSSNNNGGSSGNNNDTNQNSNNNSGSSGNNNNTDSSNDNKSDNSGKNNNTNLDNNNNGGTSGNFNNSDSSNNNNGTSGNNNNTNQDNKTNGGSSVNNNNTDSSNNNKGNSSGNNNNSDSSNNNNGTTSGNNNNSDSSNNNNGGTSGNNNNSGSSGNNNNSDSSNNNNGSSGNNNNTNQENNTNGGSSVNNNNSGSSGNNNNSESSNSNNSSSSGNNNNSESPNNNNGGTSGNNNNSGSSGNNNNSESSNNNNSTSSGNNNNSGSSGNNNNSGSSGNNNNGGSSGNNNSSGSSGNNNNSESSNNNNSGSSGNNNNSGSSGNNNNSESSNNNNSGSSGNNNNSESSNNNNSGSSGNNNNSGSSGNNNNSESSNNINSGSSGNNNNSNQDNNGTNNGGSGSNSDKKDDSDTLIPNNTQNKFNESKGSSEAL